MLGALLLSTSCNDEWKDEQYHEYISFKAPLNGDGVYQIRIPYTRNNYDEDGKFLSAKYADEGNGGQGLSDYQLPVIVSGSLTNSKDYDVHLAFDPDTLDILNVDRFQARTNIYYKDMSEYATIPEVLHIKSGENVAICNVRFNFKDIDMTEKWVLPIQIVKTGNNNYEANPRKSYSKALLRVFPFNDWSGYYSATGATITMVGTGIGTNVQNKELYLVDENTCFFYAGDINEDREDHKLYKIFVKFDGNKSNGNIEMWSDNPKIKFHMDTEKQPTYSVVDIPDGVKDYLVRHVITINNFSYYYTDYTASPGTEFEYNVSGSMTLSRNLNTLDKNPQYQIQWW